VLCCSIIWCSICAIFPPETTLYFYKSLTFSETSHFTLPPPTEMLLKIYKRKIIGSIRRNILPFFRTRNVKASEEGGRENDGKEGEPICPLKS
jgi:hypothetical protein